MCKNTVWPVGKCVCVYFFHRIRGGLKGRHLVWAPLIFSETRHLTVCGCPGATAFLLKKCLRPPPPPIENSWIRLWEYMASMSKLYLKLGQGSHYTEPMKYPINSKMESTPLCLFAIWKFWPTPITANWNDIFECLFLFNLNLSIAGSGLVHWPVIMEQQLTFWSLKFDDLIPIRCFLFFTFSVLCWEQKWFSEQYSYNFHRRSTNWRRKKVGIVCRFYCTQSPSGHVTVRTTGLFTIKIWWYDGSNRVTTYSFNCYQCTENQNL